MLRSYKSDLRIAMAAFAVAIAATASGAEPTAPPLFDGLGTHSRPVTAHAEAQKFFDQGLAFLFAFNHDEAIRSFEWAAALDPKCAMAHWGVAVANGSHINNPEVAAEREKAALAALRQAERTLPAAAPADAALIAALALRYSAEPNADRAKLNAAYSAAMKAAWDKYPHDADLGALYAESMMNLRPWDLWTLDGQPQPGTLELVTALEAVMKAAPKHPLALHLYIHAVEASPNPGRAEAAADQLRHLQPGLGHMVHMPSHIDVRCGNWLKAVEANERAIQADAEYRKRSPKQGFYHLYMAHNHHMLAFAAMMRGESKRSLDAVRAMLAGVPKEFLADPKGAAIADGFLAAPLEVMMRFGKWDDILKEPAPPEGFPIARTLWHHARGVAYAAKGRTTPAREELVAFRKAAKATPKEAAFGNNSAADLYAVAGPMLEGEVLAAEGKLTEAIQSLTVAVAKEDTLRYDEPPDWVVPVRHALGAFLLKAGRPAEAEKAYRDDLKKWPNNGWSLYGLSESLSAQGRKDEAHEVRQQWVKAWANADVPIRASCLCIQDR